MIPKKNTFDKKEFNSGNDTLAVNILLDTPNLDLTIMSATTSQHLVFEKEIVDQHLKGKSELGGLFGRSMGKLQSLVDPR